MLLHAYVESVLARHAAPCLAGIKPSNLVSFPCTDTQWCTAYNKALNKKGVYFTPLGACMNHSRIFIYRKDLLVHFCANPQTAAALRLFGYQPEKGIDAIITHLKERISASTDMQNSSTSQCFPHEIGLLLGYPACDVMQYIKMRGSRYLLCGYWKVYSKPEQALQIFNRYTECKEHFALQIKRGMTICQIVCAV